ncbi:MAG: c-type cytochrome domain-containing protein [Anaerolineales bacterium]
MTVPTRILTLTILLVLSLVLVACGNAATENVPPREEPAPVSEPASPTDSPENKPATEASPEPEAEPAAQAADPISEPTPAQDGAVSFRNDILPIFENTCVRCHGGLRTERGLDLSTYDALMRGSRNGAMLIPGDADSSELAIQVVSGEMPRRAPKLPEEHIQLIIEWVNQGALDN